MMNSDNFDDCDCDKCMTESLREAGSAAPAAPDPHEVYNDGKGVVLLNPPLTEAEKLRARQLKREKDNAGAAPATPDKCPACGFEQGPTSLRPYCPDPWHKWPIVGAAPATKPPDALETAHKVLAFLRGIDWSASSEQWKAERLAELIAGARVAAESKEAK